MNDDYRGLIGDPRQINMTANGYAEMQEAAERTRQELATALRRLDDQQRYIERINPGYTPQQRAKAAYEAGITTATSADETGIFTRAEAIGVESAQPAVGSYQNPFVPHPSEPAPEPEQADQQDFMRYAMPRMTTQGLWADARFAFAMELLKATASIGLLGNAVDVSLSVDMSLSAAAALFSEGERRGWVQPMPVDPDMTPSEEATVVRSARAQARGNIEMSRMVSAAMPQDTQYSGRTQ